jgi:hypothetical protein
MRSEIAIRNMAERIQEQTDKRHTQDVLQMLVLQIYEVLTEDRSKRAWGHFSNWNSVTHSQYYLSPPWERDG